MNAQNQNPETGKGPAGLSQLIAEKPGAKTYNPAYSKAVRWLRLTLPLTALAMTAVVFTWSNPRQPLLSPDQPKLSKNVGKNELLNPRFENTDSKNRPYTLTAARAVQDTNDESVVILEKPVGDMTLENNKWIALEATEGAFKQDLKRLLLRGNVRLFHNGGYQLETPELQIDIETNRVLSNKDIHGQGPAGTIDATGLMADNEKGVLIFRGPAKLVLNTEVMGSDSKGFLQ